MKMIRRTLLMNQLSEMKMKKQSIEAPKKLTERLMGPEIWMKMRMT